MKLQEGEIFNETYQVRQKLDQGGSGIVYLAYHLRLQKYVVIKKIKDHYVGRINDRREADILKGLHHKYLPQVYDFIQRDQSVFTVMDYIEGCNLLQYIKAGEFFSERQMLIWMRQLCEVLDYLHSQTPAIIHSDIKPSNIMITPQGDVCLIDFNISFGDGDLRNMSGYSQRYASPEQIYRSQVIRNGGDPRSVLVDCRTDIFSLGASFYHLMTGCPPAEDGQASRPLTDYHLSYSPWFLRIVEKSMQMDPARRYQSASQLLGDLIHIYERDEDYKRLKLGEKLVCVTGFFCIMAGALCLYFGTSQMNQEHFQKEYEQLEEMAKDDDYDKVVDTAIDLLNNKKYTNVLARQTEEKGNTLYMIANCYFEQEDYSQAVTYYEKALACHKENPEYYRDYGIALARNGQVDQAKEALNDAIEKDLGQSQIYLVQAEIALAKGENDTAIGQFRQAIEETEKEYDKSRAYLLCARAYRAMGDYEGEVQLLVEAQSQVSQQQLPAVLRALGAACTRSVSGLPLSSARPRYEQALQCYEQLVNLPSPTFNDEMNVAVVKQILEDYEGSRQQLLMMKEKYLDDYRVYMKLALLECVIQGLFQEDQRNYQAANTYYQQAQQYYEPVRVSGKSDEQMQNLEQVMQDLRDKGWL